MNLLVILIIVQQSKLLQGNKIKKEKEALHYSQNTLSKAKLLREK
jgi:hypothetical protein